MQDHMDLGSALEKSMSWRRGAPVSESTLERRAFDGDCAKWEKYDRERRLRDRRSRLTSQNRHGHRGHTTQSNVTLTTMDTETTDTLQFSMPANYSRESRSQEGDSVRGRSRGGSHRRSGTADSAAAQQRRVCRSLRVFIAWKA